MRRGEGGDGGGASNPPHIVGGLDCSTIEAFPVSVYNEACARSEGAGLVLS